MIHTSTVGPHFKTSVSFEAKQMTSPNKRDARARQLKGDRQQEGLMPVIQQSSKSQEAHTGFPSFPSPPSFLWCNWFVLEEEMSFNTKHNSTWNQTIWKSKLLYILIYKNVIVTGFSPQQERHKTHEDLKIWYQVNSIIAKWCFDGMRYVPLPGLILCMYPHPVIPHAQGHCPVL